MRWIPQKSVVLLEQGYEFLAARGRVAANDMPDARLSRCAASSRVLSRITRGIHDDRFEVHFPRPLLPQFLDASKAPLRRERETAP